MKGKVAPTKTTKAYVSFCLSLSAVVPPVLVLLLLLLLLLLCSVVWCGVVWPSVV